MCVKQLTIINPHYVKLAKENNVNIRVFDQEEDYRLHVPCGHCDECLRKRQQNWFLRANHIMQRMRLQPEKCLFCTFSLKPEVYEEAKAAPYKVVRKFIDRLRKHPRFREKNPETGRYRYRKVRFPYFFVVEFSDGKRSRERGLPSTHRMHYHAILFNCPLYWWQVRDLWAQNGIAWVEPLNSMAGVRYCMKYMTKDCPANQYISDIDARKNGKFIVSHGFGRLSKEDIKIMRENMLKNDRSWFSCMVGNFPYSIPRYWKTACFTKVEIKCRNDSLIPPLIWRMIDRKYPCHPMWFKKALYNYLLWP